MNYLIKSCLFKIKEELNTFHYSSTTLLPRLQRLAQKSTADADNQSSLQGAHYAPGCNAIKTVSSILFCVYTV